MAQAADLVRLTGRSEVEVERVLTDFSNRRLIRRVQREEGSWHELAHEYLVEEIGNWLSEEERRLKRVRELLEQALRNYRNLGMVMAPAEIRLIKAQRGVLHLSEVEHQLLRDSEQTVGRRRKGFAAAAAVAALLVLASGVTARYVFLRSHTFIQSTDRRLVEYRPQGNLEMRMESIQVYTGSPARWWLDGRLGFPKLVYQTDFDLDQIAPGNRDAVKAGVLFGRNVSAGQEILGMFRPDETVRFLLTGRAENREADGSRLLKNPQNDGDGSGHDGLWLVGVIRIC